VWHGALIAVVLAPLVSIVNVPKLPIVPSVEPVHVRMQQVRSALDTVDAGRGDSNGTQPSANAIRASSTLQIVDSLAAVGSLGTAAFALWFVCGWLSSARLSRRAKAAPVAWQLEVNALCHRLRIDREVRLGLIDEPMSPIATGLLRPAVLLPRASAAWSDERRRAVLLHELAHIKRGDCGVQLVAQIACAIYWFHPLVWMAAGKLRSERERACDDHVLRCGARPSSYASHLLDIASELRPSLAPSAALAMARPSELEGRLLAVLAAGRARVPFRATRWGVIAVISLTTIAALSATSTPRYQAPPVAVTFDNGAQYVVGNDVTMSSEPAPEPLANVEATLQTSDDAEDRELATLALAFSSGRDVIPALLKALTDRDSQVREKAAIGLALRRDERVVGPLIAAMSDPDSQVREKAAIALGTSGDPRAHDALVRALDDGDAQVREKATAALVLLGVTR
jgi:beta-lactamase regulating signal transducer with metallopeptidase domain